MDYVRPLVQHGPRPSTALSLAGQSRLWFDRLEHLRRGGRAPEIIAASELDQTWQKALTSPRADIAGLDMNGGAHLMGIVNVTPDSFSDGGTYASAQAAVAQARRLADQGAALVDIGGESTRPGAAPVPADEELARILPVLDRLQRGAEDIVVSVDTRKAAVARGALAAGAHLLNDVSALTYDAEYGAVAQESGAPLCLMHAQGDPQTMQAAPRYEDVLLDVFDFLAERVAAAEALGIERRRILVDPGIGFGKTLDHNLALLRGISLFHGLGCPILLGVSRKRFIGTMTGVDEASERVAGSVAVGQMAALQGVQILRVHDVSPHRQMLDMLGALL